MPNFGDSSRYLLLKFCIIFQKKLFNWAVFSKTACQYHTGDPRYLVILWCGSWLVYRKVPVGYLVNHTSERYRSTVVFKNSELVWYSTISTGIPKAVVFFFQPLIYTVFTHYESTIYLRKVTSCTVYNKMRTSIDSWIRAWESAAFDVRKGRFIRASPPVALFFRNSDTF